MNFSKAVDVIAFWLLNGKMIEAKPLHNAPHNVPLTNNVKQLNFTLELKHVTLAQSGTYTCGVNSTGASSTQDILVSVHDAPGPNLELEQTTSYVEIVNGTNTTLRCVGFYPAASYVDTFWLFNGSRIRSNSSHEVNNGFVENSEGNIKRKLLSLTIYNAGQKDSGEYTCVLNTSHGLQMKNITVYVAFSQGKPSLFIVCNRFIYES